MKPCPNRTFLTSKLRSKGLKLFSDDQIVTAAQIKFVQIPFKLNNIVWL